MCACHDLWIAPNSMKRPCSSRTTCSMHFVAFSRASARSASSVASARCASSLIRYSGICSSSCVFFFPTSSSATTTYHAGATVTREASRPRVQRRAQAARVSGLTTTANGRSVEALPVLDDEVRDDEDHDARHQHTARGDEHVQHDHACRDLLGVLLHLALTSERNALGSSSRSTSPA